MVGKNISRRREHVVRVVLMDEQWLAITDLLPVPPPNFQS